MKQTKNKQQQQPKYTHTKLLSIVQWQLKHGRTTSANVEMQTGAFAKTWYDAFHLHYTN